MAESATEFDDRIYAEGRKTAFYAVKARFKRDGITSNEAYHKAKDMFPPMPIEETAEVKLEDDFEIIANCPIIDSIMWAVERLHKKKVKIQDAPSSYAWTLYKNAKGNNVNTAELIRLSIVKLIPSNKQIENAARMQDDGQEIVDLIERIMSEA